MARKAALDIKSLTALGVERLARLALDEAQRDPAFRKIVKAALAATDGPDAVAKLIDRRLSALEKARSYVDWQKERAFRDDLAATLETITGELARASPAMGMERLLHFIGTHDGVFERVDDSGGRVQDVYRRAVDAMAVLASGLSPDEADPLPEAIMARLEDTGYGYLVAVAEGVASHLPPAALDRWDALLVSGITEHAAKTLKPDQGFDRSPVRQWGEVRQAIADARGDLDGFIALEAAKYPHLQNTIQVAERLLSAGREAEALDWVRRTSSGGLRMMRFEDIADAAEARDPMSKPKTLLEARILEALGRGKEAQALRWKSFETTVDADILRAYVAALPEFEEFEVLDRAFAHALASPSPYRALVFLLEWPRLDNVARLVIERAGTWDGRYYTLLGPAVDVLKNAHPLAAAILLRALTEAILDRANSKAYPHAARYLQRLDALTTRIKDTDWPAGIETPEVWRDGIDKKHARKSGLWACMAQLS